MAAPWPAMADCTWAGVHWAAIWRGEGRAPMTLERRAMGPPSSSVDIHGTTCPCAVAAASRAAMPGPDGRSGPGGGLAEEHEAADARGRRRAPRRPGRRTRR